MDINHPYEKMSAELNSSFVPEANSSVQIKNEVARISNVTNTLSLQVSENMLVGDFDPNAKEFISSQLISLIADAMRIKEILSESIKIGSRPTEFMAYANLVVNIGKLLGELRELFSVVSNVEMRQKSMGINKKTEDTVNLTTNQLYDLITKAQSSNQLDAVDATFSVEESN